MSDRSGGVPLTVIGGYLGAGKTTLVNRMLREPGGRRLGVIVNDFGELAIDAELLAGVGPDGVVSLPNGCVCCTLGLDLQQSLVAMMAVPTPPDHVVIEVSGVADPAATAAWGTVEPFEPGGIVVLAAADSVRRQATDRYVGDEVRRQLAGADLVIVTKPDLLDTPSTDDVAAWCGRESHGAPVVIAERGAIPVDVVLGLRPPATAPAGPLGPGDHHDHEDGVPLGPGDQHDHEDGYVRVAWTAAVPVGEAALRAVLDELPLDVLRLKGLVLVDDGTVVVVDVVGRHREVRQAPGIDRSVSAIVAIGLRGRLDPGAVLHRLDALTR